MADLYPDWMGPQGVGDGPGETIHHHSTAGDTTIIEYVERKKPKLHMKFSKENYKKKSKIKIKVKTIQ